MSGSGLNIGDKMKLPAEGETVEGEVSSGSAEQQVREEETTRAAEGAEVAAVNGSGSTNGSEVQRGTEPDFSEFLWMEHEDEFDEQVLKELEDEEIFNYYVDMYGEEQEERGSRPPNRSQQQPPQHHQGGPVPPGCNRRMPDAPRGRYAPPSEPATEVDDITRGMDRVNFGGRLNPHAAEFVPRTTAPVAVNTSDANDCPPPDTQPC